MMNVMQQAICIIKVEFEALYQLKQVSLNLKNSDEGLYDKEENNDDFYEKYVSI